MALTLPNRLDPFSRAYAKLAYFTQTRYWHLKLAVFLTGLVLITTYPSYLDILTDWRPRTSHSYFFNKMADPFAQLVGENEATHGAKIAFRLTVPLLAKMLNLGYTVTGRDIVLIFVLQSLLLVPFFILLSRLLVRYIDPVSSLLLTVAFSGTYVAKAFFWDYFCWFDGYAYFFLLAGMYFREKWVVFVSLFLACWTDERAIIALGGVYVFHRLMECDFELRSFRQLLPDRLLLSLSWVMLWVLASYAFCRWILMFVYGLRTPVGVDVGVSFSMIPYQLRYRFMGILLTFEGLWIFIALAATALWYNRNKFLTMILIAGIVVHIIVAYSVYDITRSLAYGFPFVLTAIVLFNRYYQFNKYGLRQIVGLAALTCVLIPTQYVVYDILHIPWSLFSYDKFVQIVQVF
jgi:hypothetical protein